MKNRCGNGIALKEEKKKPLTTFNLHGALLRVVRIQMEIHGAGENQRQPGQTEQRENKFNHRFECCRL